MSARSLRKQNSHINALLKDKMPKKPKSSKNRFHTLVAPSSVSVPGKGDKDKYECGDKDKDKDRGDGTRELPFTIPFRSSSDVEPKSRVRDNHPHRAWTQMWARSAKRYVTIVEGGTWEEEEDGRPRTLSPFPLCPPSYVFFVFVVPQGFVRPGHTGRS